MSFNLGGLQTHINIYMNIIKPNNLGGLQTHINIYMNIIKPNNLGGWLSYINIYMNIIKPNKLEGCMANLFKYICTIKPNNLQDWPTYIKMYVSLNQTTSSYYLIFQNMQIRVEDSNQFLYESDFLLLPFGTKFVAKNLFPFSSLF